MNRLLTTLLMVSLLLVPAIAPAQQTAEKSATYAVDTGDAWIDTCEREGMKARSWGETKFRSRRFTHDEGC